MPNYYRCKKPPKRGLKYYPSSPSCICLSSSSLATLSWYRTYRRIISSFAPTESTKYPLCQK